MFPRRSPAAAGCLENEGQSVGSQAIFARPLHDWRSRLAGAGRHGRLGAWTMGLYRPQEPCASVS